MSQGNAVALVQSRAFVVGSIDAEGYFSMSSRPVGHATLKSALSECSRLTQLKPGTAYVAMQLAGGAYLPEQVIPAYL